MFNGQPFMVLLLPQAPSIRTAITNRWCTSASSKVENPEWYPELRTGAPLKDMDVDVMMHGCMHALNLPCAFGHLGFSYLFTI